MAIHKSHRSQSLVPCTLEHYYTWPQVERQYVTPYDTLSQVCCKRYITCKKKKYLKVLCICHNYITYIHKYSAYLLLWFWFELERSHEMPSQCCASSCLSANHCAWGCHQLVKQPFSPNLFAGLRSMFIIDSLTFSDSSDSSGLDITLQSVQPIHSSTRECGTYSGSRREKVLTFMFIAATETGYKARQSLKDILQKRLSK